MISNGDVSNRVKSISPCKSCIAFDIKNKSIARLFVRQPEIDIRAVLANEYEYLSFFENEYEYEYLRKIKNEYEYEYEYIFEYIRL